ncbi:hypothetical protein JOQ06_005147, partial [Pogonophryne albipinna]
HHQRVIDHMIQRDPDLRTRTQISRTQISRTQISWTQTSNNQISWTQISRTQTSGGGFLLHWGSQSVVPVQVLIAVPVLTAVCGLGSF